MLETDMQTRKAAPVAVKEIGRAGDRGSPDELSLGRVPGNAQRQMPTPEGIIGEAGPVPGNGGRGA